MSAGACAKMYTPQKLCKRKETRRRSLTGSKMRAGSKGLAGVWLPHFGLPSASKRETPAEAGKGEKR